MIRMDTADTFIFAMAFLGLLYFLIMMLPKYFGYKLAMIEKQIELARVNLEIEKAKVSIYVSN